MVIHYHSGCLFFGLLVHGQVSLATKNHFYIHPRLTFYCIGDIDIVSDQYSFLVIHLEFTFHRNSDLNITEQCTLGQEIILLRLGIFEVGVKNQNY